MILSGSEKTRVIELQNCEEVVIRVASDTGGGEIRVSRVGSDDPNCPFASPFLHATTGPYRMAFEGAIRGDQLIVETGRRARVTMPEIGGSEGA